MYSTTVWNCINGKLLSHIMSYITSIIQYSKVISENTLPSHLGFLSDVIPNTNKYLYVKVFVTLLISPSLKWKGELIP